jgi:hypothetical protein
VKILGVETSCDDTAVAVLEGRDRILANVVSSQTALHRAYGGIVPELASRHHLENIQPILDKALADAGSRLEEHRRDRRHRRARSHRIAARRRLVREGARVVDGPPRSWA